MKLNFQKIDKEYLLDKNSQETYLEYYLGIPVKKGLFKSPLRTDNSPTCAFYRNKSGDIIFKDFRGCFSGNFINVVMYKYDVSYYKAMKIIANDFNYIEFKYLPKNPKPISYSANIFKDVGSSEIQVEIQNFSDDDLKWWDKFGINKKILKKFRVYSCKTVFLNNSYFTASTSRHPIFGYYKEGKDKELWRIYFPTKTSYRFLSNLSSSMIQGGKQLPKEGEILVITKSLKDVMCLYSFGIPAIAPNSENLFVTEKQFEKLKLRFKKLILFYDNDLAGISNMNKIRKKFKIECIWIPRRYQVKDISDFYCRYGKELTLNLIENGRRIKT